MLRPLFPALALALLAASATLLAQTAPTTAPAHGTGPAATFPANVPPPVIRDKFTADPHAIVIGETCLSKMEFAPNPAGGPDIIKPVDVTNPAFPEGSKGEPVPVRN